MKNKETVRIILGNETPEPKNIIKVNVSNNNQNTSTQNQNPPTETRGNQTPTPKPSIKQNNGSQTDSNKKG